MNRNIEKELVNIEIRVHRETEEANGTTEGEVKVNHCPQNLKSCRIE